VSRQILEDIRAQLEENKTKGLYKKERVITSPQQAEIAVSSGGQVLNFCANNYLGLSNSPAIIEAAQETMARWGYGLSSVRFICGTLEIHKELEQKMASFLKVEDPSFMQPVSMPTAVFLNLCSGRKAP